MGAQRPNLVNPLCQHGEHSLCSHKMGSGMNLVSRKREPKALLCTCTCHSACPVGGKAEVSDTQWFADCTCPGGQQMRDIQLRVRRESEERKAQNATVLRDVSFQHGQSPDKVQETLLTAYEACGYEPPSDFSRWSRFIAAGTGRRGTRTPRLLFEAVSGLWAVRRWTPGPAADGPPRAPARRSDDDQEAHNQSEVRKLGRTTAAYGFVAAAAATGAYFTSGVLSVLLAVVAALFAAITAWMVLWYIGLSTLTRVARNANRRN